MTAFALHLIASSKLVSLLVLDTLVCHAHPSGMAVCAKSSYMLSQPVEFRVDCNRSPNFCRHLWCCPEEPIDGHAEGCAPSDSCAGYQVACPDVWSSNGGTCG